MRERHSNKTDKRPNPAESNNNIPPQAPPKQEKMLPKEGDIRKVQQEELSDTENEQITEQKNILNTPNERS